MASELVTAVDTGRCRSKQLLEDDSKRTAACRDDGIGTVVACNRKSLICVVLCCMTEY